MFSISFPAVLIIAGVITHVGCKSDPPPGDCSCADAATGTNTSDAPIDVSPSDVADPDPSTGIAECDAYVAYFKACTVRIAGWTPTSAQAAANVMISEFALAGATAAGKMTAAHCVTELTAYKNFASATCPDVK